MIVSSIAVSIAIRTWVEIVGHHLVWFIRSEEILVVITGLQQRCQYVARNSLLPFPYNKVIDESPPAGAAKHRVPGYYDN